MSKYTIDEVGNVYQLDDFVDKITGATYTTITKFDVNENV